MSGPCGKVRVTCRIVSACGLREFNGENWTRNPQSTCPREEREGYGPCVLICRQPHHAEEEALRLAGPWAKGATAFVQFHRTRPGYVCDRCATQLRAAGVVRTVLLDGAGNEVVDEPTWPVEMPA